MTFAAMERKLYLLLGSNLGDRFGVLKQARKRLEARFGKVSKASSFYATAAWGNTAQPDFINQVLLFECSLEPQEVLSILLVTEEELGRVRKEKWGPRTIDIDLLIYGDLLVDNTNLKIPHPELHKRRFTLVPLCELAEEELHPKLGKTYSKLLEMCEDGLNVKKTEAVEYEV